jgi:hypothetical protein
MPRRPDETVASLSLDPGRRRARSVWPFRVTPQRPVVYWDEPGNCRSSAHQSGYVDPSAWYHRQPRNWIYQTRDSCSSLGIGLGLWPSHVA